MAARDVLDAVLAVGERSLQAEEKEHLRQRQGDHRRVDTLPADRQEADDQPEKRRAGNADENAQLRRQPPFLHRVGGEIRRAAEERSEEHTSELQSLLHISYAVFCSKKQNLKITNKKTNKYCNKRIYLISN